MPLRFEYHRPASYESRTRLPQALRGRRVLSPRELAQLIERERDRADRTATPFTMIVFHAEDAATRREVHAALGRVLAERLRISDELGMLDRSRLAAVLPASSAAGAWTVADDVCLKLPASLPLPKCEVYAYPGEQPQETPRAGPLAVRSSAGAGQNGHGRDRHRPNGNGAPRPGLPSDREPEVEPARCEESDWRLVRPLERLFIRPLPWWKRATDFVVALTALVALAPLLLLVAMAVKLTSPGPVLFRQMRSGLGGRPFVFYKFRSMVFDAEARKAALMALNEQDGPAFKIRRDPRVTRLGHFLRQTSLDELPQLWNILRGEMSLVGPRPLPCNESDACTGWHRRRLEVTPGLTCIWQVEGRSKVSFDDWVRMDIRYMHIFSMVRDVTMIVQTVPAMLLRRGI